MTRPDLTALPDIILDQDEPVFAAPWEAQVFAMAINLHQRGAFGWDVWARYLSREIHCGVERPYYQHWLSALEKIVAEKNITSLGDLSDCRRAWHAAAATTPHGQPIELAADGRPTSDD